MRLTLLLLFLACTLHGQESITFETKPVAFNFAKAMSLKNPTEPQLDSLFGLLYAYYSTNGDTCLLLGQKAIALTKENPRGLSYARALVLTGMAYRNTGDDEKSFQLSEEGKAIAEAIGADDMVAEADNNLGTIALREGDSEMALAYFISSAEFFERLGNRYAAAKIYKNISTLFFNRNEWGKSQDYSNRVVVIAKELQDDELLLEVASSQGIDLMTHGIYYYLDHEQDTANITRHRDTLDFYFQKSEEKYEEALAIAERIDSKEMQVVVLNNFVALSLNMENYDQAYKLAIEAERQAEVFGSIELLIQSKFNLGSVYQYLGRDKEAEVYGEEALALAKENKLERKAYLANRNLYDLYTKIGKYDKANKALEEMSAYEKRTSDVERSRVLAEVEAQYQTVKKEKQILELEKTNTEIVTQRNYLIGGALSLFLLSFLGFQWNKNRRDRNDRMAFAEALILAQETERKRIASDLHDGIGQSLLLLKKNLVATHEVTAENQEMISNTLEEVRTISRDLHPLQLEKFGLTAAINETIEKVERSTDLFITTEIENIDGLFSDKEEIHLFRVIQEAMSNIVKHAEATAAKISVEKKGKEVILKVMDNGKGYDLELTVVRSKSLGLRTMHERVAAIGGQLKIEKNIPSGTVIRIAIPLRGK